MAAVSKQLIVRELLWLLGILVAAVPLALALYALVMRTAYLRHAWLGVLTKEAYVLLALYLLLVLGGYLARLGALGAARLATTTPEA